MSNQPTKTNEGSCPALCRLMCHAWRSSSHWRCRVLLQRVLAAPTVMLMSSAATSPDAAGGDLHRCVRRLHRHRQKFQLSVVGNFEQGTRVRVVRVWGAEVNMQWRVDAMHCMWRQPYRLHAETCRVQEQEFEARHMAA